MLADQHSIRLQALAAWLQEGLAQKLSGDTLPAAARGQPGSGATHAIRKLENLRQDWSRMNTQNALAAYSLALAAADALYDNYASYGIRNILSDPETLPVSPRTWTRS